MISVRIALLDLGIHFQDALFTGPMADAWGLGLAGAVK